MQVQKYPKYIISNRKYYKRTIYSLQIDTMVITESLCKSSPYHWHGLEFYNKVMLEGQGHSYFQFCVKCLISGLDTSKKIGESKHLWQAKNVNILILQTVLNIFTITSLYSYVLSIKCNIRRKKQICILKVFSVIRKFWLLLLSIWRPWCHAVFNHLSFEVNLDREHYVLQIMH